MKFDTHMLKRVETYPEALLNRLAEYFTVFVTFSRQRNHRSIRKWSEQMRQDTEGRLHCDLASFSRPELITPSWKVI